MNNDNRFLNGFLLGALLGGSAVFLFGTRTGKNLLKIVSEQGLDGLISLLEEYDFDELNQIEEAEDKSFERETESNSQLQNKEKPAESKEENAKRRFFKRLRK